MDAHSIQESRGVSYSTTSNSQQLGIVTWNSEHFSTYDIEKLLTELEEYLGRFNGTAWTSFFVKLDTLLKQVEANNNVQNYRSTQHRRAPYYSESNAKMRQLCSYIDRYREKRENFSTEKYKALIAEEAKLDWKGMYSFTLRDREARILFRKRVKLLKNLIEQTDSAKSLLRIIREMLKLKSYITQNMLDITIDPTELNQQLSTITQNIPTTSNPEHLKRAVHARNIVIHLAEMFKKNADWLDIIALQEINNPDNLLYPSAYAVYRGPHLISAGKKGQNEYYPLLVSNNAWISLEKIFVVHTNGDIENVVHDQSVPWDKHQGADSTYRPIVVYCIKKHEVNTFRNYLIGVVHTTPLQKDSADKLAEYSRRKIYESVHPGLAKLKALSDEMQLPLIIAGDYYLTAEALVEDFIETMEEEDGSSDEDPELLKIQSSTLALKKHIEVLLTKTWIPEQIAHLQERLKFITEAATKKQILRNVYGLTVAAKIQELDLCMAQPISGTNPKEKPLHSWFNLQIADFFVYNKRFTGCTVGIMRPEGKITIVDEEDLRYSRYWQHFSDHFPVGAIFSLTASNEALLKHPAMAGRYFAEAVALAQVSNTRRFARLNLIRKQQSPDLTGRSEAAIQQAAREYLQGYLHGLLARMSIINEMPDEAFQDIEHYIAEIQKAELGLQIEFRQRLFVTDPGDFEPTKALPFLLKLPPPTPHTPIPLFITLNRPDEQLGWNCGDLALGIKRDKFVQWLLDNAGDANLRALLVPEIILAGAQSFANQAALEKKEEDEARLQELFHLFDETNEDELRATLSQDILALINKTDASKRAANRGGLPLEMVTSELQTLLSNYYQAHEAMREVVSRLNDLLLLRGEERLDALQLQPYVRGPRSTARVDPATTQTYQALLDKLLLAKKNLRTYAERQDVFTKYVTLYYDQHGWIVYHCDFANADADSSTSIIDAVALFKQAQVRIWTKRGSTFWKERETAQYGPGVIDILYNGYNHFIGLQPNPDLVGFSVL